MKNSIERQMKAQKTVNLNGYEKTCDKQEIIIEKDTEIRFVIKKTGKKFLISEIFRNFAAEE